MDIAVSTHPVSTHPRDLVETGLHLSPVGKQKSNSTCSVHGLTSLTGNVLSPHAFS